LNISLKCSLKCSAEYSGSNTISNWSQIKLVQNGGAHKTVFDKNYPTNWGKGAWIRYISSWIRWYIFEK